MATLNIPQLKKYCTNPTCVHKGELQSVAAFYVRSGVTEPRHTGHYLSECKACMKARTLVTNQRPHEQSHVPTENLALDYLRANGVHALPGKAVSAASVDVVAWGGVWIEVKFARLKKVRGHQLFTFNPSLKQMERGYLAHIVLLICEYPNGRHTFHLFDVKDEVFYKDGHIKHGFTFRLGAKEALKHGGNRVVMTQAMMDAARDNLDLIPQAMRTIANALRVNAQAVSARERTPACQQEAA